MRKIFVSGFALISLAVITIFLMIGCNHTDSATAKEGEVKLNFSLENFAGQTVKIIVPHGVGGGYDTYARLFAPHIEKQTGAKVVIENISGAGGVVGCNEIFNAEPDGFTIGFTAYKQIIMHEIVGIEAAQYSLEDFAYLGRVDGQPSVMVADAKSNARTVSDLQQMDVVKYGEGSAADEMYFVTMVFGRDHGINFMPVTGYEGTADLLTAVLRGEFVIMHRQLSSLLDFIEAGELVPLVVNGFKRFDAYPEVPTMLELATTEEQRQHAFIFATMWENSRGFVAPPGMTPDIQQVWIDVIDTVVNDPILLAEANQRKLPLNYLNGVEATALLLETVEIGKDIKPLLAELSELAK